MKRYSYDLTHYLANVGEIGRLQTLSVVPVIANDSHSINLTGAMRLSPLRRSLSLDSKLDVFTFFVPHRHVYPDWAEMVKEGMDSEILLPTVEKTPNPAAPVGYIPSSGQQIPLFYTAGYAKIWNEYFRIPNVTTDPAAFLPEDALLAEGDARDYGYPTARLPDFLTTGALNGVDTDKADVEVDEGVINLLDLSKVKGYYKDNVTREWFATRYRDVLAQSFGSGNVNTDADERPTLCMQSSSWLSGYDIDGTDDATLGSYVGKSQAMINHNMPMKHFNEGGALWTMAVVRFPTIWNEEQHYLGGRLVPQNYENYTVNPEYANNTEPVEMEAQQVFGGLMGLNTSYIGTHPYASWYRSHPNHIHHKFRDVAGYPFVDAYDMIPLDPVKMGYEANYDLDMFQSEELAHWNMIGKMKMESKRIVPPASNSLYAGTMQQH